MHWEPPTTAYVSKLRALIQKTISVSLKTLLLFILKFNVNVTIPIPNIEECGPRLVKTSDWSDHHISASDWLKEAPPPLPTDFDYVAHPTAQMDTRAMD